MAERPTLARRGIAKSDRAAVGEGAIMIRLIRRYRCWHPQHGWVIPAGLAADLCGVPGSAVADCIDQRVLGEGDYACSVDQDGRPDAFYLTRTGCLKLLGGSMAICPISNSGQIFQAFAVLKEPEQAGDSIGYALAGRVADRRYGWRLARSEVIRLLDLNPEELDLLLLKLPELSGVDSTLVDEEGAELDELYFSAAGVLSLALEAWLVLPNTENRHEHLNSAIDAITHEQSPTTMAAAPH